MEAEVQPTAEDKEGEVTNLDEPKSEITKGEDPNYVRTEAEASRTDEELAAEVEEAMKETYGTHKVGFDPMKKADVTNARMHGEAKMVRNLNEFSKKNASEDMICECCGLPVQADLFPICAPINDLQELGPGIPLYYWFVKYLIVILGIGFLIVGIACWASNANAGRANDYGDDSDENYVIVMSIGNHGHPDDGDTVPVW
jgi:hypothetical protein